MTMLKNLSWWIVLTGGVVLIASSVGLAAWQPHEVRQHNGKDPEIQLPAQFQMLTKNWNRVVAVPYIIYMPEKDRLLMLANCDFPHRVFILTSDDHGANWTEPRPAIVDENGEPAAIVGAGLAGDMGTSLAYLGSGKALFRAVKHCWFSRDYGKIWGDSVSLTDASADGKPWGCGIHRLSTETRKPAKSFGLC